MSSVLKKADKLNLSLSASLGIFLSIFFKPEISQFGLIGQPDGQNEW